MSVLIDTGIWSLALRRRRLQLDGQQRDLVVEWRRLIEEGSAAMAGPIRQELLSGIRALEQFERVRANIAGLDCPTLLVSDFDQAAIFYNHLRRKGISGGPIDLLICAIAYRQGWAIFTTDRDFERYARHLPIRLHRVGTS